jgi:hypothetical protein
VFAEQYQRMKGFYYTAFHAGSADSLKMFYEAAKKRGEPYNKIVGDLPEMRRDTVELVKKSVAENRRVYVNYSLDIVDECACGMCAWRIQALMKALQADRYPIDERTKHVLCPANALAASAATHTVPRGATRGDEAVSERWRSSVDARSWL